jgi:hypothetical protein
MPSKESLVVKMKKVTCHNVKVNIKYFDAIVSGKKTFEIRFDDRNYQEGDFIVLHKTLSNGFVNGETVQKRIGFITDFEQKQCYIVFSLLDI